MTTTDVLLIAVPLLCVGVATLVDLRTREVPDWIPVVLLTWAVGALAFGWAAMGWTAAIGGLVLGLVVGGASFALGGLGGGDVKLLAALGAALGPLALVKVLVWMALAGGVLALLAAARGKKDLAYVPAIAAGLLVYTLWPHALGGL